jgi:titin
MGNIPAIGTNNFTNTNDTAYYYPGVNNTSILPSFFTNLVQNDIPLSTKPSKPVISNVTVSNLTATIVLAATTDTIINYSYSLTIDGTTYTPFSPIQSSSPLQISGLTTGTSYTFRVKAIGTNASSDASEPYGPVLVAGVPSAPTISSVTVSSGTATIAFTEGANNGSAITSYKYSKDNGTNWVSVSTTSSPITVAGLNNGSTYTFVIRAVNAIGDGESSNAVEKMVNVAPGAPTISNVTFSSGIAKITFTSGANNGSPVTSYKYSKDNGANWVSVSTISSPISISGLKPGISHQIILKASNGLDSDPSNTYTFTYYIKTGKTL